MRKKNKRKGNKRKRGERKKESRLFSGYKGTVKEYACAWIHVAVRGLSSSLCISLKLNKEEGKEEEKRRKEQKKNTGWHDSTWIVG